MKLLIMLFVAVSVLDLASASQDSALRCWLAEVDPAVAHIEEIPDVGKLGDEDRMVVIGLLLSEKGNHRPAQISGVTRMTVSAMLPQASVEVAALFYISYLYYGRWDHCNGIALVDKDGHLNSESAIADAYRAYEEWYSIVKGIGLKAAHERGLHPLPTKSGVAWY